MNIPLIDAGLELGNGIVGVVDQWVEDKDLAAKLKAGLAEKHTEFLTVLYTSAQTPGYVKFLYALRDVIVPLVRPMVSGSALGFIAYAQYKGFELPIWIDAIFASLFPAWGASRWHEKIKDKDIELERERNKEIAGAPGGSAQSNPFLDSDRS